MPWFIGSQEPDFRFVNFDSRKLIKTGQFISIRIMGEIYLGLKSFAVTFQLNRNDSLQSSKCYGAAVIALRHKVHVSSLSTVVIRQQDQEINEPKKIASTRIDLDKTYKNKLHRLIVVIKWQHHAPNDATKHVSHAVVVSSGEFESRLFSSDSLLVHFVYLLIRLCCRFFFIAGIIQIQTRGNTLSQFRNFLP